MVAFRNLVLALSGLTAAIAAPVANATANATANADLPDFHLGGDSLVRRQDYNQNYKTSGNVNFSPASKGYSVSFSNAGDFVVGKGWNTGSTRSITFNGATTKTAGTVLTSVYGWTTNPLIEYYIQEYTSDGKGSAQGTLKGSVTCDGSVYDIYLHQQVNQPSISGTTTFNQYISNRRDQRPGSGTVTTKCHFDAWKAAGLSLGTFNYQVLATEGWGNAGGNANYAISAS